VPMWKEAVLFVKLHREVVEEAQRLVQRLTHQVQGQVLRNRQISASTAGMADLSTPRRGHPPLPVGDTRNRQLLREVVELMPFVVSAVRRRLGDLGECEEPGNYSTGVD